MPFVLLVAFSLVLPVVRLVSLSFDGGLGGYRELFSDQVRLHALTTTLWMSAVVAVGAILIGYLIAWTLRSTQSGFVRVTVWVALLLPMFMSVVVKNYAWTMILGHNGVLNAITEPLGLGVHTYLFTSKAVVIGMVYTMYPYAALPLYVAMSGITDAHIRAAQSLGATRATLHRTLVLPLIAVPCMVTAILLYVLSMGFYVVPQLLGGPNATFVANVVGNDIFLRFDTRSAAATSMVLLVIAFAIIGAGMVAVGRDRFRDAIR
jgi:ABC-type spermidine/putrescine transport system permease subunit I